MRTSAGRTYKAQWQRLAAYVHATWGHRCVGGTLETTLFLLEHLRRIEEAGVLPTYDDEGVLVRSVEGEWVGRQLVAATVNEKGS